MRIAAQSKALGCPANFWFTGFSMGGQLALWAVKAAQELTSNQEIELDIAEIWRRGGNLSKLRFGAKSQLFG